MATDVNLTRKQKFLLWLPGHTSVLENLPNNDAGNRVRYHHLKPISAIAYGSLFCIAATISGVVLGVLVYVGVIALPPMVGLFIMIPSAGGAIVFIAIYMCQKGKQIQFEADFEARPLESAAEDA